MSNNFQDVFSQLHTFAEKGQWQPLMAILLSVLDSSDPQIVKSLQSYLMRCEGAQSWTPLMLSCARAPPKVIAIILQCCPMCCTVSDSSDGFPLHFVCCYRRGDGEKVTELQDVIRILLRCSPESVSKQNIWGQTPLHCLFDGNVMPPVDALKETLGLFDMDGLESKTTQNISSSEDDRPNKNESVKFDQTHREILRCHVRKALAQPDAKSNLPLHLAASKGASEEIFRLLLSLYPDAAALTTADGDLPLHLLRYHAEDISSHEKNKAQNNMQLRMFQALNVGQVEALLEPLCVGFMEKSMLSEVRTIMGTDAVGVKENGALISISERDEDDTELSAEFSKASTSGPVPTMIVSACRSYGSRRISPIHIAAEYGVSYQILSDLCKQYPEGVGIPKSSPYFYGNGVNFPPANDMDKGSTDIYAIELFENGRAKLDIANRNSTAITDDTFSAINRFNEKSDLLFSYYPEAVQSKYNGRNRKIMYKMDPHRLSRLEDLIRKDFLNCYNNTIGVAARLTWRWLCKSAKFSNQSEKGIYKASVGRIITDLPDSVLWKLGYIAKGINRQTNVISGSSRIAEISMEQSGKISFTQLGYFINEQNIEEEALERAPNATMSEMLKIVDSDKNEFNNWHDTFISFLSGNDAMNYSSICKCTKNNGLTLLPKISLKETGRTWNLLPRDEVTGPHNSELWQGLDAYFVQSSPVHLVYVTYYLEVSKAKSSPLLDRNDKQEGGLLVLSESTVDIGERKLKGKSLITKVEAKEQKEVVPSRFVAEEGCEVQLCFNYNPGNSYRLHVYGPFSGGRVSISSARIRLIVRTLNDSGQQCSEKGGLSRELSTHVTVLDNPTPRPSGELQLHNALKNGIPVEDLSVLIATNPSSLLKVDDEGRTPLHTIFFLDKPPSLSIMKTLLTSPGENATKLKDSHVMLPLHIAASKGANEAILRLLVEAYADGCYRLNKDGDLPLHLLVRSGFATPASVELLIRPILDNETICRLPGSQGTLLPLHAAVEYNCSYKVFESLLLTYGEAAAVPREIPSKDKSSSRPFFALDIFEQMKCKYIVHITKALNKSEGAEDLGLEKSRARVAAQFDIAVADLNLKSDLLFVFNPTLLPLKKGDPTSTFYRKDSSRIKRIVNHIRREAISCAERRKTGGEAEISELARLGWYFLCTFNNEDPTDNYTEAVASILKGLSRSTVQVLQNCISNPSSTSMLIPMTECATPSCKKLILSRIQFVGRYTLEDEDFIIHESDGSLVIGAKDYGLVESYEHILSLFRKEYLQDVDDLASTGGSVVNSVVSRDDPKFLFVAFAQKVGFNEEGALREYDRIVFLQDDGLKKGIDSANGFSRQESYRQHKKEFSVEVFKSFCLSHKINDDGVRSVIFKFMKHRSQFQREKSIRERLTFLGPNFPVFPIIDDYDTDRIDESNENEIISRISWKLQDSKDALYAIDIHEQKNCTHNFSLYKYALVMPRGDRDLAEILLHEECDALTMKSHVHQIGSALDHLHTRSVIHGDLSLSNVVRYGTQVVLVDFDSSFFYENDGMDVQSEVVGSSSNKCCSGIMPPELIAKIDILENRGLLRNYETYWKHVLDDVADMKELFAFSRKIETAIKTLIAQYEAVKTMGSSWTPLRTMKNHSPGVTDPHTNWKDLMSQSLIDIAFEELPNSLTTCKTIQEFAEVWTRLKKNTQLWEKIHPRISLDNRYAYMVKSYEGADLSNPVDLLPYSLVHASTKHDIWAFGVMLFYVCSGVALLPLTYNGQLCNISSYEDLHHWNSEVAWSKISNFVDDPLAQNLLMKLLVTEDERLPSMDLILQHPYFKPSLGKNAYKILEDYDRKLYLELTRLNAAKGKYDPVNHLKPLCMEKICKEVFRVQGEILVPTCFMILPFKLHRSSMGHLEAPQNISSLAVGEKVGKHLLDINAVTAKLSFWLKMKKFTSGENGVEYRRRLKLWLKRARNEPSHDIAEEIIAHIGCDKKYKGICVEMLDEGMNISNAREFIQDPWKAAVMLYQKSKHALLQYYPRTRSHAFYLIDEYHGTVALPEESFDDMGNVYPFKIEISEGFEDIFLPFINMTVMSVTAKHGMKGLARLLGLPSSYGIPDTWKHSNIGLVHSHDASGYSTICEFAHIQQVLNKSDWNNFSSDNGNVVDLLSNSENYDSSLILKQLEIFYQQNDPRNSFCGLHRFSNMGVNDVMWTRNEASGFHKMVRSQPDREFQYGSGENSIFDSQGGSLHRDIVLHKPNLAQCTANTVQITTRSNKIRASNVTRKIPSSLSDFTPTTKQTQGSISTVTYHSTTVSNSDRHNVISSEPILLGDRQRDYPYSSMVTPKNPEFFSNKGNSSPIIANTTMGNHHSETANLLLYNHSAHISIGARQKHETHSSVTSVEDGGYFGRQASMLSSVTLKKHHHAPSDISSLVSNSTLEKYQGYNSNSMRTNQPPPISTYAKKIQKSPADASSNKHSG